MHVKEGGSGHARAWGDAENATVGMCMHVHVSLCMYDVCMCLRACESFDM